MLENRLTSYFFFKELQNNILNAKMSRIIFPTCVWKSLFLCARFIPNRTFGSIKSKRTCTRFAQQLKSREVPSSDKVTAHESRIFHKCKIRVFCKIEVFWKIAVGGPNPKLVKVTSGAFNQSNDWAEVTLRFSLYTFHLLLFPIVFFSFLIARSLS